MKSATLDASAVRALLGESAYPVNYVPSTPIPIEQARRKGKDLKTFIRRIQLHEPFIICRYLEGYSPEQIASMLAAHPETIRIRIRKAGLFPTRTRGKPKKGLVHPIVCFYRRCSERTRSGILPTLMLN